MDKVCKIFSVHNHVEIIALHTKSADIPTIDYVAFFIFVDVNLTMLILLKYVIKAVTCVTLLMFLGLVPNSCKNTECILYANL